MRRLGARAVVAALLVAGVAEANAQELVPADYGPRMATREALTAHLDSLQLAVASMRPGSRERTAAERSIQAIGRRLRDGDVYPGDVVQLSVVGEERWTLPHTVTPQRTLALEAIDPIDVSGVLHSELEESIARQLSRYLRDPRVQVDVLKRIGVTGQVARPGFYTITGSALVSEAVMLAGGPGGNANVDKIRFRRLGADLEVPNNVVWQSMSLDDLGVQSGDEMFIPQSGSAFGRFALAALGVALSLTFLAVRIF